MKASKSEQAPVVGVDVSKEWLEVGVLPGGEGCAASAAAPNRDSPERGGSATP